MSDVGSDRCRARALLWVGTMLVAGVVGAVALTLLIGLGQRGAVADIHIPPPPPEPSRAEAKLLSLIADMPLVEIEAAKDRFPVPVVVRTSAGEIADDLVTSGRAGAPMRIDIDGNSSTGPGGADVRVIVDITSGADPDVEVEVEALHSAALGAQVDVSVLIPFEGFVTDATAAPVNAVLGFQTGADGLLPDVTVLTLHPGDTADSSRTSLLELAVDDTNGGVVTGVDAGHFHGDAAVGVVDSALFRFESDVMPATASATLDVDESPLGSGYESLLRLDWQASSPASLEVERLETGPITDFGASISLPTAPTAFEVHSVVAATAGTWQVSAAGGAPLGDVDIDLARGDGLRLLFGAQDASSSTSLTGRLDGTVTTTVDGATADLELQLIGEAGFPGTDPLLGSRVVSIGLAAQDLPDLAAGFVTGSTSRRFDASSAAEIDRLEMIVAAGVPPVVPGDWATTADSHVLSLVDDGVGSPTAAARIVSATEVALGLDTTSVATDVHFETGGTAPFVANLELADLPAAVRCDVGSIQPGVVDFSTDFLGSISYSADPPAGLDAVTCAGNIGAIDIDLALEDLPALFTFAFSPDSGVEAEIGPAASGDTIGSLQLALATNDTGGLPGTGALFGEPIGAARIRVDDLPSSVASWSNGSAGFDLDVAPNTDTDVIGGLQVAVATVGGSTSAFGDAATLTAQHVDLGAVPGEAPLGLDLALRDLTSLSFGHDGDLGLADLDVVSGAGTPLTFDVSGLFGALDEQADARCNIGPLPSGLVTFDTDYASQLSFTTNPSTGVDSLFCVGEVLGIEFETTLFDVPSAIDVTLDPAGSLDVSAPDALGSLALLLIDRDGSGLVPTGTLLTSPVRTAQLTISDVPPLTASWAHDADGALPTRISIEAKDGSTPIGSVDLVLRDSVPAGLGIRTARAWVAQPDDPCTSLQPGFTLDTVTSASQCLAASLQQAPVATFAFDPTTGQLSLLVLSARPQLLNANLNTAYPDLSGTFQPLSLQCVLDETPAGLFVFSTDLSTSWSTTTDPATGIDRFQCVGQNANALYQFKFLDLPPAFGMTVDPTGSLAVAATDGPNEAIVGEIALQLGTTDDQFGLLGTEGLFGEQLREFALRLDDVPEMTASWAATPASQNVEITTDDPLDPTDPPASLGGLQLVASAADIPGLDLGPPPPAGAGGQRLRYENLATRAEKILEIGLFDVERFAFTQATGPNVATEFPGPCPADGGEPGPADPDAPDPTQLVLGYATGAARPLDASVRAIQLDATQNPPASALLEATILIDGSATTFDVETDLATGVCYVADGSLDSISVSLDTTPVPPEGDEGPPPVPSELRIDLLGLPSELDLSFEQAADPATGSTSVRVDVVGSSPIDEIALDNAGPDPEFVPDPATDPPAPPPVASQQIRLFDVPAELSVALDSETIPAPTPDDKPVTEVLATVDASGNLGLVSLDTVDPVVATASANRVQRVEIQELPPHLELTLFDDGDVIDAQLVADDGAAPTPNPQAIGLLRFLATTVLADDFAEQLAPFVDPIDGLTTFDGCLIERSPFARTIEGDAFSSTLVGLLDETTCNTDVLATQDHLVTSTHSTQRVADDGGPQTNEDDVVIIDPVSSFVSVLLRDLQALDVQVDKPDEVKENDPRFATLTDAHIEVAVPGGGSQPLFVGALGRLDRASGGQLVPVESLMLVSIEEVPDSLVVDLVAEESIDIVASESPGRIELYSGPRGGATVGDAATRVIIEDTPTTMSLDYTGLPDTSAFENFDPTTFEFDYALDFDASNQFRVLAALQSEGMRTLVGLDAEDFSLSVDGDGIGYTPCDRVDILGFQTDTCFGLFRLGGVADAVGSTSGEGASGYVLYWPALADPEDLSDGTSGFDVEYVPQVTALVNDFRSLVAGVELQLDPLNPFATLYPLDLEVAFAPVFGADGGFVLDFWDVGFDVCFDPPQLDGSDDPGTSDDVCVINDPDYIANNPWHIWPLLHGQGDHFDPIS